MQTIKFKDFEHRPSNSTIWRADRQPSLVLSRRGRCCILPGAYPCEDLSADMLDSFLRRRLGGVLHVWHHVCVVCCATEAAALTVMLLSLPLRCQQNCVDLTGTFSLVLCRQKVEALIASLKWLPSRAADPFNVTAVSVSSPSI